MIRTEDHNHFSLITERKSRMKAGFSAQIEKIGMFRKGNVQVESWLEIAIMSPGNMIVKLQLLVFIYLFFFYRKYLCSHITYPDYGFPSFYPSQFLPISPPFLIPTLYVSHYKTAGFYRILIK